VAMLVERPEAQALESPTPTITVKVKQVTVKPVYMTTGRVIRVVYH